MKDETLEFIFNEKIVDDRKHKNMIKRFVPRTKPENIGAFVNDSCKKSSFYSFLAEALMAIILKDLFNYKLAASAIDICHTLLDVETGADCCMYDSDNCVVVLGEAKFYQKLGNGINKIIANFTKDDSFFNKLYNFQKKIENCNESCNIVLKKLSKDLIEEFSFEEFLTMNIHFVGFVLHEHEGDIKKYFNKGFYDKYDISSSNIVKLIQKEHKNVMGNEYKILMIHLPINNKKQLIENIISKAYTLLSEVGK